MIILKSVIQYATTNGLEATWVDQIETPAPFIDGHDIYIPPTITDIQVKCHSYADVQMDMFRADAAAYGTPLDDYEDMIADIESKIVAYVPPPVDIQSLTLELTQLRLDTFAKTRNYDGILSACTYATDPNPVFAAEGQKAVDLRSSTWASLYSLMAEVQAGTKPAPTSYEEIEAILPVLSWE